MSDVPAPESADEVQRLRRAVAERLTELRKAAGLSQRDATVAAKRPKSDVWRFEAAQRVPRGEVLADLMAAYGASDEDHGALEAMVAKIPPRRRAYALATPLTAIAERLQRLRINSKISGVAAAAALGVSTSKLSRMLSGKILPTESEVERLCEYYEAPEDERRALIEMVHDLREGAVQSRVKLRRNVEAEARVGRIHAAATVVSTFASDFLPVALQTERYMRALFAGEVADADVDSLIAARLAGQAAVDSEQDREIVLAESALLSVGGPDVMVEALSQVITAIEGDTMTIGVLPPQTSVSWRGISTFELFDFQAVLVADGPEGRLTTGRKDIVRYATLFEELSTAAVYEADAIALLRTVMDRFGS